MGMISDLKNEVIYNLKQIDHGSTSTFRIDTFVCIAGLYKYCGGKESIDKIIRQTIENKNRHLVSGLNDKINGSAVYIGSKLENKTTNYSQISMLSWQFRRRLDRLSCAYLDNEMEQIFEPKFIVIRPCNEFEPAVYEMFTRNLEETIKKVIMITMGPIKVNKNSIVHVKNGNNSKYDEIYDLYFGASKAVRIKLWYLYNPDSTIKTEVRMFRTSAISIEQEFNKINSNGEYDNFVITRQ